MNDTRKATEIIEDSTSNNTMIATITVLLPFIEYSRTLTTLNCLNELIPEENE